MGRDLFRSAPVPGREGPSSFGHHQLMQPPALSRFYSLFPASASAFGPNRGLVACGHVWTVHGRSMDGSWTVRERFVDGPWTVRGLL